MKQLNLFFVRYFNHICLAVLVVCLMTVQIIYFSTKDTQPTPQTPQTPVLTPANAIVETCALIVYEDTTAYTIEGEPTFNLAQGTHTETDGLTGDFAFYRIHENDTTAYVRVSDVVPVDATCLEHLPTLTDVLPQIATDTP